MLMRMGFVGKTVIFPVVVFLFLCVAKVSLSATPTGTPCTCSGSKYIVLDTNGNGEPDPPPEDPNDWPSGYDEGDPQASGYDAYWTMEQNGNQVYVKGHGMFPNPYFGWDEDYFSYDKSTGAGTITLTEQDRSNAPHNLVLTAGKINGSETFNKVDFFWKTGMTPYAVATMVDSNGDGQYDSAVGESDMQWIPPVLFDRPIEIYTAPNTNKNYWLIPSVTVRISRTSGPVYGPRTGGFKVFVPVGSAALEVKCGDDVWGRVALGATPAPTVTAINPPSGPIAGGTDVEITGTNFENGATVRIGGNAATNVTVVSATRITATTPAHDAGAVDVVVANPDTQSGTFTNGYHYVAPGSPSVTGINPPSGPIAGGTDVEITGTNFVNGVAVTIGGNAATNVTVVSATRITATTPAHDAGAVDVVVANPDTQSGTLTNGYNYVAPGSPSVTGINPPSGPIAGGTDVEITGTNFVNGVAVTIGGNAATNVTVVSATRITATTPAHDAGAVDVVVANPDTQSGTLTNGYNYVAPGSPSVTGINPPSGPIAGGTDVEITGTNFVNGATVRIGGNAATDVTVVSATRITATTPAHDAGAVDVVVANPDTQSGTLTNGYNYVAPGSPSVTGIHPDSGPTDGGTNVEITGTNFVNGAAVALGGNAATDITVVSGTKIRAKTPGHHAGVVDVKVTNPGSLSAVLADAYEYLLLPHNVPTLSQWGSAIFVLIILLTGVLLIRKTGFGERI